MAFEERHEPPVELGLLLVEISNNDNHEYRKQELNSAQRLEDGVVFPSKHESQREEAPNNTIDRETELRIRSLNGIQKKDIPRVCLNASQLVNIYPYQSIAECY